MVPGLLPKILVLFLMPPDVELLYRALPIWLNVFLVNRRISEVYDISGLLAQSAERGADNAKVVSSTLARTNICLFF